MSRSTAKSFSAILEPFNNGLGWVVARIPFDVAEAWPVRKGVRVRGEIEGFQFRTALFGKGETGHILVVNRKMQAAAKAGLGSKVRIRLEPDLEEREAEVPAELARALKGDRRLRKWFDGLNDYMRRMIGALVAEAKAGESREQRAETIAEWLLAAMESETETPPILKAAFLRQPLAGAGWEAMSPARRRSHLLAIFHYRNAASRERRAAQAVQDAVRAAGRMRKEV